MRCADPRFLRKTLQASQDNTQHPVPVLPRERHAGHDFTRPSISRTNAAGSAALSPYYVAGYVVSWRRTFLQGETL